MDGRNIMFAFSFGVYFKSANIFISHGCFFFLMRVIVLFNEAFVWILFQRGSKKNPILMYSKHSPHQKPTGYCTAFSISREFIFDKCKNTQYLGYTPEFKYCTSNLYLIPVIKVAFFNKFPIDVCPIGRKLILIFKTSLTV